MQLHYILKGKELAPPDTAAVGAGAVFVAPPLVIVTRRQQRGIRKQTAAAASDGRVFYAAAAEAMLFGARSGGGRGLLIHVPVLAEAVLVPTRRRMSEMRQMIRRRTGRW